MDSLKFQNHTKKNHSLPFMNRSFKVLKLEWGCILAFGLWKFVIHFNYIYYYGCTFRISIFGEKTSCLYTLAFWWKRLLIYPSIFQSKTFYVSQFQTLVVKHHPPLHCGEDSSEVKPGVALFLCVLCSLSSYWEKRRRKLRCFVLLCFS